MPTLKVFFPGRRYGIDRSFLYYLDKYIDGDSIYLEYDVKRYTQEVVSLEENIESAYKLAFEKLKNVDFKNYTEVIFIAKSIGTAVAGKIRESLKLTNLRCIMLTPINETIPYLKQTDFIITSFDDPYIDAKKLKENENRFPFLSIFKDIGHSLEYKNNLKKTIDFLYENLELALNYLDTAYKDILEE